MSLSAYRGRLLASWVFLAALHLYAVLRPAVAYRTDCEMAWNTLAGPDLVAMVVTAVSAVVVLDDLVGRHRRDLVLASSRPLRAATMTWLVHAGWWVSALVPAVGVVALRARTADLQPCFSPVAVHYAAVLLTCAAVGAAWVAWSSAVVALAGAVASVAMLYYVPTAMTGLRLADVGSRPIPTPGLERSWSFTGFVTVTLLVVTAAAVLLVTDRRTRAAWAALVALVLALGTQAPAALAVRPVPSTCQGLRGGVEVCAPEEYAWVLGSAARELDRVVEAARAAGVEPVDLPRRIRLWDGGSTTAPGVVEMPLPYGVVVSGSFSRSDAVTAVTFPSWCPQLRRSEPPVGLLEQSSRLGRWLQLRTEAVSGASDGPVPTDAEAVRGFAAQARCRVADGDGTG